jgi:hypothetical protein
MRRADPASDKISPMNERQQSHVDYFLERIEYWRRLKRDDTLARMLAARDADDAHPLRNEEEGSEVFEYLRRLEYESPAEDSRPR